MLLKSFSLIVLASISCLFSNQLQAQNPNIDIQKYTFSIELNDEDDMIKANAEIAYLLKNSSENLILDLEKKDNSGRGMLVDSILVKGTSISFTQNERSLIIPVSSDSGKVTIFYHGIPKDGLIISKNKYGNRTFFGDNWPNRAHQWLPSIDHPSDKAFVDFKIIAPSHYQVVANGTLKESTNLEDDKTLHYYSSEVALPTKVMVFGAAEFAVQNLEEIDNIPVSSWVYPQNKEDGFYDYAQATEILKFFIENIGEYPFSKLANVQSTTRYGGMENASNIFYSEKSVTGKRDSEFLMAHEIAHQWFGDSASETDWSQLWLSEGFATYFTDLYAENKYGKEKLQEKLKEEREKVIRFSKTTKTPIIDTTRSDYMKLLNPNSYQKGAWVLHMLRQKVGDENFWKAIKSYYKNFKLGNATSKDLQREFETTSGQDLNQFFNQWLLQYGQPVIKMKKTVKKDNLELQISQSQKNNFTFPLEIQLNFEDGTSEIKTFQIDKKKEEFNVQLKKELKDLKFDPNVNLLFEPAN